MEGGEPRLVVAFADESESRSGIYCFAGVVASAEQIRQLTRDLDKLMAIVEADHGVRRGTEIHAREVFQGLGPWAHVPPRLRLWLQVKVSEAIRASGVELFARGVDGVALRRRQSRSRYPMNFTAAQESFKHLLQRIDDRCGSERCVLVIADERSDRDSHRTDLARHKIEGTPGDYWHTTFSRVVDTIHFSPSDASRMLQAADHLAFFYRRRQEFPSESDRRVEAGVASVVGILEASNAHHWGVWFP